MSSLSDVKKYIKIFQSAFEQKINEADTSIRISKFLEDVFGYDMLTDFTKEFSVKDRYVDIALKLPKGLTIFIEVKQAGLELRDKHIEQACNYASNSGVEWVILTNGIAWRLYHLTFDTGIESDLLFEVDISKDPKRAMEILTVLDRKSVLKGSLDEYLDEHNALSPKNVLKAFLSQDTMKVVRKEIKKLTGSHVPEDKLWSVIRNMIAKEAWEKIGDVKLGSKIKGKSRKKAKEEEKPVSIHAYTVETEKKVESIDA